VGNITTGDAMDAEGKTFSRHWDQITPENAGKWGSVQSNAGAAYNWRTLDAIYDYAENAGIVFKQHAFVWGSQQPSGSLSEANVKAWITEFCRRYPNTRLIDVVNEPPPHTTPSYANAIGGGTNDTWQWITNSFVWAREACPDAILILNDFSNVEYARDADHFLEIVKTIQAAGAPIDAVGAQAHDLDDDGMDPATVRRFIERLHAETGLPIYITEMDINQTDDQAQLRFYQDYFPYFRDSGYVKGLTIWGWIYGRTWSVAPYSGLVRNGMSRPAMTWLMEQLDRPVP
jgi:endo-1,4-beta-xylanase